MQDNARKPAIRFAGFNDAWEQRKLGERIEECTSRTSDFSKYPLFSLTIENGVTEKTERYERGFLVTKTEDLFKIVPPSCFVTNPMNLRFGAVGCNRKPYDVSVSGYYDVFSIDEGQCSEFWNAYLKTRQMIKRYDDVATGSLIEKRRVHFTELKKIEVPAPTSIAEKRKIGEFFLSLDHLIALHQRKYAKLVNIKKSMLEKMFPQNGSNVPEIRFAGFTDAWEQRKFGDLAIRSANMSAENGLPRVEYEDIISGTGQLNKDIFSKESSKTGIVFHKGDVLYGKLRPYLQNWLLPQFNGLAVGDFWVLQPQNMDSSFLYRLIQSRQFDEVANQSTGTKMPRADWKLVSKSDFFVPPSIDEQAAIGNYFEQLDHLIALHQRKLERLQNIKKACLEKMFV
ncbi:MAG: restriction endonuclease subunit S [Oscillospiraceae bacterium]|nr:restriction endonuclease subunit S [Oscillospiraceae bacterium]